MNQPDPPTDRNHGSQPLDALMTERAVSNQALVAASPDQLTFKQVGKARKGRQLTRHMQMKIKDAFSRVTQREWRLADLFNYRGT